MSGDWMTVGSGATELEGAARILTHTIGVVRTGRPAGEPYRNHYVPGGVDVARCEQLQRMGLMGRGEVFGATYFFCTPEGIDTARRLFREGQHRDGLRQYMVTVSMWGETDTSIVWAKSRSAARAARILGLEEVDHDASFLDLAGRVSVRVLHDRRRKSECGP